MRLKLDEDLGQSVAGVLRQAAHDVVTVVEEGMSRASDRVVIEASGTERRCLVTLDMEFANPILFNPAEYAGIAVLRFPPRASDEDLFAAVQTLVAALVRGDIKGRLWVVQRGRVREYQPGQ